MDVPAQEVITRDNVTVRVNAVAYFRVVDPSASVVNVADFIRATSQISQTTLRSILGQSMLDELLAEREKINRELQQIIDLQTEPWGIKVSVVEVRDVELPQTMQRAMARQAEAEREKRAKIIHAEGEFQASQQLAEAAEIINRNPVTIQLRYLQTLTEIGAEKNTTVVFPLPLDFLEAFAGAAASFRPTSTGGTQQTAVTAQAPVPTSLHSVPPPISESPIAEPPSPPEQ
jgi:regulator of protease activity HflC (stomatin/prohibitin superfamily)